MTEIKETSEQEYNEAVASRSNSGERAQIIEAINGSKASHLKVICATRGASSSLRYTIQNEFLNKFITDESADDFCILRSNDNLLWIIKTDRDGFERKYGKLIDKRIKQMQAQK